jgi:hypothetical protein
VAMEATGVYSPPFSSLDTQVLPFSIMFFALRCWADSTSERNDFGKLL